MAMGRSWARDELIVAMNLYCKLPFGQLHHRNPVIIALAEKLGRTPSSVAMKLCNFASLDPVQQARGISGLSGASAGDRQVWEEFHKDWERLAFESEQRRAALAGKPVEVEAQISEDELPREGLERERVVRQRVNQSFFRAAVLAAYGSRCCVTGLAVPDLLVASHIVPWAKDKANRVNPRNGLCLNALHDSAFDRGFITLTAKLKVEVSPTLKAAPIQAATKRLLLDYDDADIRLPERFLPDAELLEWHRTNVFRRD
ncbi:MAG: HNH endonuclease [Verrucomicrobia bacterium]|nr:HNH endonuclease [Verrucomicrobiota bacterium]